MLVLTGGLLAISLISMWWPPARWAGAAAAAIGLMPLSRKAVAAIRARLLDMNVLMTVAIVGALMA